MKTFEFRIGSMSGTVKAKDLKAAAVKAVKTYMELPYWSGHLPEAIISEIDNG